MTLRIISGERRGAHLRTPPGDETRPLRDRVREALFNILRPTIRDAVVLDAFAGSGAVGLEALSNGAAFAIFIEPDRQALDIINFNIRKLRYEERTRVIKGRSPAALANTPQTPAPFSHLFLMPPYHSGLCISVLNHHALAKLLRPDALAVCEIHRDELLTPPAHWTEQDSRLYGVTRIQFLRHHADHTGIAG